MIFDEACTKLSRSERMDLWQARLEKVDRAIERSDTGWALTFWNNVRRQLVRQLHLLSLGGYEK